MKRILAIVSIFFVPVFFATAQGTEQPPEIPEPATWTLALLGGGAALAVSYVRRRRR